MKTIYAIRIASFFIGPAFILLVAWASGHSFERGADSAFVTGMSILCGIVTLGVGGSATADWASSVKRRLEE